MPQPPHQWDPNAPTWTDPYWHRQCFLSDGQYWWIGPDGLLYLYTGFGYYQYVYGDTGVVMTPDTTPPVDAPPDAPAPAAQTMVYSLDGTRSVQVSGDTRDAYLYDLTVADPNSAAAQGRFIGTQVAGVKFDYVTANGIATQSIQQIELSYDDATALSVVDLNGERRVDVSGTTQDAVLTNLTDSTVAPVPLASGASPLASGAPATSLSYQTVTDDSGNSSQSLSSIALTVTDGSGNQSTLTFDRDGNSLSAPAQSPDASAPSAIQTLQDKMQGSETFRALKSGFSW